MISLPEEVQKLLSDANTHQEEAWLNIETEIAGIPIRQMTLEHYFLLNGFESPFLTGKEFGAVDIGIFLWILSPEHKRCTKACDQFCKKIAGLNIVQCVKDIKEYLEITFLDADTSAEKQRKRYASFVAYQIDTYAKEYGWSVRQTMEMPLRQIFQLNSAIGERYAMQAGEKYTKLRNIDMAEASALLQQHREQNNRN